MGVTTACTLYVVFLVFIYEPILARIHICIDTLGAARAYKCIWVFVKALHLFAKVNTSEQTSEEGCDFGVSKNQGP